MGGTEDRIKYVNEKVRLHVCKEGDEIQIRYRNPVTQFYIGRAVLRKIKPLIKGEVQIKYQTGNAQSKVLKTVLPANLEVERTRLWVEADGEDVGFYKPKRTVIDPTPSTVSILSGKQPVRPNPPNPLMNLFGSFGLGMSGSYIEAAIKDGRMSFMTEDNPSLQAGLDFLVKYIPDTGTEVVVLDSLTSLEEFDPFKP